MRSNIVLLACALASSARAAANGDALAGKKVFLASCATCHGKDGKGSPAMSKMLHARPGTMDLTSANASKLSDDELRKTIADGRDKMPAFKKSLQPAELDDVAAYVRSLAGATR